MICPFCLSFDTDIYNSRLTKSATHVWRRRRCQECSRVFTTYEKPDLSFVSVGSKPYRRAWLYQSVLQSFTDKSDQIRYTDDCVDQIEAQILRLPNHTIEASAVTDIVLKTLKPVSNSAFLRYLASHQQVSDNQNLGSAIRRYQ